MAQLAIQKGSVTETIEFTPPKSLGSLLEEAGFRKAHPCGGRGICGKCAVELQGAVSEPNGAEKKAGTRLSCQAVILGDAKVVLPDGEGMTQIETATYTEVKLGIPMTGAVGAALDIGTTTMALRRYDLKTGKLLGESAMENPQTAVAADVMGRIGAAMEGQLPKLRDQVRDGISQLLEKAGGAVDTMVITGNTTMLYLLTDRDPKCLSAYPFQADTLFDRDWLLADTAVYFPPCMNAFVGADITCAVLASGMCEGETALLCDIGTNGELALWKDGTLYVTSTAAGPAFEGAGISCGCGSVPGAIDKAWTEAGELCLHTIAGAAPVGLCGSGLIDVAAALLDLEWMDETGALEDADIALAPGVTLLQKDIRAVQLAKAAIAAGIETLLEASGTDYQQIKKLYIAGGFGSHLNIQSAARIGLIPAELTERVVIIGNAALAGAAQILLDREKIQQVRQIAASSRHWNLGGNPRFNEYYMNAMLFPFEE